MEDMANYLQALSDSLDKKIGILDRLAILTDKQRNIATAQTFDDEEFQKTLDEKEELIGRRFSPGLRRYSTRTQLSRWRRIITGILSARDLPNLREKSVRSGSPVIQRPIITRP